MKLTKEPLSTAEDVVELGQDMLRFDRFANRVIGAAVHPLHEIGHPSHAWEVLARVGRPIGFVIGVVVALLHPIWYGVQDGYEAGRDSLY